MIEENSFAAQILAEALPEMIDEIKDLERYEALSLVAGLQILPEFAANAVRIEALVQLILLFADGNRMPCGSDIGHLLNDWLGQTPLCLLEDPPEDVFVSNVVSEIGNTRVFEGIWESNDFTTQLILQSNYRTAQEARNRELALWPFPMMVLSEALAERANLDRFTPPGGADKGHLKLPEDMELAQAGRHCRFSWAELSTLNISRADIESYLIQPAEIVSDLKNSFSESVIHDCPLIETEDGILVLVPSSLMRALRGAIVRKVQEADLGSAFYRNLLEQQRGAVSDSFERMGAVIVDFSDEELKPPRMESCSLQVTWLQFDRAWYVLALGVSFREDNLLHAVGSEPLLVTEADEKNLILWERDALDRISRIPGFRGGLVFHIASTLGCGLSMAGPAYNGDVGWRDWNVSLADLRLLSRFEDIDIIRLAIIASIRDDFGHKGIRWASGNGDFNFISWALSVEFRLVPRDWEAKQLTVMIPTNSMLDLRGRTRTRIDEHGALFLHKLRTSTGVKLIPATLTVERHQPWSFFDESGQLSAYLCRQDIEEGQLRAAIEYSACVLWIEMKRPSHSESLSGVFHLWQALVTWFERLFERVANGILANRLPGLVTLKFVVEEPFVFDDGTVAAEKMIDVIEKNSHTVTFGVSRLILRQFQSETNLTEKLFITSVFEALMAFCGVNDRKSTLDMVIEEGFRGRAAKSMHVAFRTDVRAMLHSLVRRSRPTKVSQEVKETSRIGLAQRICPFISAGTYRGPSARWLLNTSASRMRLLIKQRLVTIDRKSVIQLLFENMEVIEADNWQYRISTSALFDLHGGIDPVDAAMRDHVSTNEGTLLASKIAIEMAVCDSPTEGGLTATHFDLRWLISQVLVLIEFGYQSDALYTGLAEIDDVKIHPNGDVEADSGYWNETVVPFRQGIFRRGLEGAAEGYAGMIGVNKPVEPMPDRDTFLAAFIDEVGLGLKNAFEIVRALGLLALSAKSLVIDSIQDDVLAKIVEVSGVPHSEAYAFFEYFSLDSRPVYEVPTPGFVGHDIHPWRFSRRLSLVRRPILRWDEGGRKRVLVSPAVVEQSLGHFMVKFSSGEYEPYFFRSKSALAWLGKVTKREGDAFEDDVAQVFRAAGFSVRQRIFMPQLGAKKELGEIDVIAFDPTTSIIWVIECKNLREARTIKEIAEQLGKCTGRADIKDDIVYKHLRRMDWLRINPEALTKLLGLVGDVEVVDRIVTSRIVPMKFRGRAIYPINQWVLYNELETLIGRVT